MWHRCDVLEFPVMRATCSALAVVLLAIVLSACGESAEEKAQGTVCDARDDIAKEVDELKSLTPPTVTTDAVRQSLDAIKNDLYDIAGARLDLNSDRRAANKAFASAVEGVASQVVTSLTDPDAKAALVRALQQLEASYFATFAGLNCD